MPIGASTEQILKASRQVILSATLSDRLASPSELCEEANLEETKKKKILFVAGGVGTAPIYPQVKWLHEHGVDADVIVGAKTKDLVILEDEIQSCSR